MKDNLKIKSNENPDMLKYLENSGMLINLLFYEKLHQK